MSNHATVEITDFFCTGVLHSRQSTLKLLSEGLGRKLAGDDTHVYLKTDSIHVTLSKTRGVHMILTCSKNSAYLYCSGTWTGKFPSLDGELLQNLITAICQCGYAVR